ncbi:hypothetical protein [Jiulongibacter sp. NS-SX5]|uniref:hypothetical protein n=1 Tax=Jiulongibacter sp. NS-SX5 TaxID=3463854 RepID=UPI004059C2D5
MQFEDIARLRVEILGEGADKDLKTLNKSAKSIKDELHLIEVAGEKGSAKWQELKKLQRDLNAEIREQRKAVDLNNASYNELLGVKKSLNQELKKTKIGSDEWVAALKKIEPVNEKLKEAGDAMRSAGNEAKSQKGLWSNVKEWVMGAFAVTAIMAFGRKLIDLGKQVFDITAKFEKYSTVLSNTLLGQDEAAAAMDMIKDIAATTPISVDEMTDSFIKMVNRGLKPTAGEIKQLADLAASQGKSFDQLTEAVLDAMMGEGERLKEFGVKMRKSGDDVSLMFKNQTVNVKNNEKAIFDAIVAMGAYNGVAGMTSEISKTLEGRVSNLGDAWDFVQLQLGEKLRPVFVFILDLFAKGVEWLSRLIDASEPVGEYYGIMADIFRQVWDMGKSLFLSLLPAGAGNLLTMKNVIKAVVAVMGTMLLGVKTLVSGLQILVDTFIALTHVGKAAFHAMKGEFALAAVEAEKVGDSWDNLKSNAKKNFNSITESFTKLWSAASEETEVATEKVDMYGKLTKETEEEITETKKKELKKRTKDVEEAAEEETKEVKKQLDIQTDAIEKSNEIKVEGFKDASHDINADWKKKQEGMTQAAKDESRKQGAIFWSTVTNFKDLWEDAKNSFKRNINDAAYWVKGAFDAAYSTISAWQGRLQDQLKETTDQIETVVLTHKLKMAEAANSAVTAVDNLLAGNFLGAIANGVKALGTAMDSWISKQNDLFLAKLEKRKEELEEAGRIFLESAESFVNTVDIGRIDDIYSNLQDGFSFLDGVRLDLGEYDTAERRLEQEISIGEHIVRNYNLALKNEQEYSTQRIFNINEAYNLELQRINEKYAILATQGKQAYDADTQAVRENLSQQLLDLITNEDSKTSVVSEYAAKRSQIMQTFAMADMAITEDMDQSQIDAINAAIEARNKALADLQNWYNQELTFIVNNEEQKRKEYSETERLQIEANEALAQLALENQANEIELLRLKNQEIEAAELEKNMNLEEEAARHNDVIIQLGLEKDAALAESFSILKDIVTQGYDEMMAKAQEAYNQGMITAQQYNELINQLNTLRGLTSQPLTVPNVDFNLDGIYNLPRFDRGGFMPYGASHSQGGIKLWDSMTGRTIGEIEGGEPILSRETYRNNKSLVDALLNSSVHRNGAKIFSGGSHYNYASPKYASGGVLPLSGSFGNDPDMKLMLKYLKDTSEQVERMREEHNKLLDRIAKKPGGVSLHELNSAFNSQAEAERLSNF